MAAPALAQVLKDFGVRPRAAADAFAPPPDFEQPAMELPSFAEMPALEPLVDTDALVAEAVAQAEAALAERLEQEHAQALQAERERHAEELAELQSQFAEEAGARILASFEDMEARLVELTSAVTARILGVILTDDIRDRSIERLAGIIAQALRDDEAVRIRVRGSQSLYEALKARLPGYADQLDFAESANFDLSVTIDDSVFETRLAEWSSALAEALS